MIHRTQWQTQTQGSVLLNRHLSCRVHLKHTLHGSLSWRHFLKYTMPGTHTTFSLANQGTQSSNSQVTQGNVRGAQNWSVTLWPWPSSSFPTGAFREGSHDICGLTGAMSFLIAGLISIRNFSAVLILFISQCINCCMGYRNENICLNGRCSKMEGSKALHGSCLHQWSIGGSRRHPTLLD